MFKNCNIEECMFVDDSMVFMKNRNELKYKLMLWKKTLKKKYMNIDMEKTKIMKLGEEERVEMEVEGIKLEQVMSFKYLGVQIQNNEKQDEEMNERINRAMKMHYTLNRNFLRMRTRTKKTKINVYKVIFCPILT